MRRNTSVALTAAGVSMFFQVSIATKAAMAQSSELFFTIMVSIIATFVVQFALLWNGKR
jgi:hypothetical protein